MLLEDKFISGCRELKKDNKPIGLIKEIENSFTNENEQSYAEVNDDDTTNRTK